MKKTKINWIIISIILAITGGLITFLLTKSWKLSIVSSVLIFVIALINNPRRRFIKAFWVILSMTMILNRYFFEYTGKLFDIDLKIGTNEAEPVVTVFLIILAGLALILDYLERGGKLKGTFLEIKKNKIGDITGDNNEINQSIK